MPESERDITHSLRCYQARTQDGTTELHAEPGNPVSGASRRLFARAHLHPAVRKRVGCPLVRNGVRLTGRVSFGKAKN